MKKKKKQSRRNANVSPPAQDEACRMSRPADPVRRSSHNSARTEASPNSQPHHPSPGHTSTDRGATQERTVLCARLLHEPATNLFYAFPIILIQLFCRAIDRLAAAAAGWLAAGSRRGTGRRGRMGLIRCVRLHGERTRPQTDAVHGRTDGTRRNPVSQFSGTNDKAVRSQRMCVCCIQ